VATSLPTRQTTEAPLDDVASFIGLRIVAKALLAVGFAGDDGLDPTLFEPSAKRIGVVAFIRHQFGNTRDQTCACFGDGAVGNIAGREHEYPGPALLVDNRVNLAVSPAFGDADRLRLGPPCPPVAQRWIFTWLLSSAT
jgi:hypothetical protein